MVPRPTAQRGRRLENEHIEGDMRGRFSRKGAHPVAASTAGQRSSAERWRSPTAVVLWWTTASSASSFSLRTAREVRLGSSIRAQPHEAVSEGPEKVIRRG
jgi:hypothetical protein